MFNPLKHEDGQQKCTCKKKIIGRSERHFILAGAEGDTEEERA
jgi:hypothetical protein